MSALHEENELASEQARPRIRDVLVVDDNAAADSLGALLTAGGHRVTVAHDGPAALQDTLPDIAPLGVGGEPAHAAASGLFEKAARGGIGARFRLCSGT